MPAILVSKILPYSSGLAVQLHPDIINKYIHVFRSLKDDEKIYVVTYLHNIYNEKGETIKEYRKFYTAPIRMSMDLLGQKFHIDVSSLATDGIPVGYILIQTLFALHVKNIHNATSIKIPILPGEYHLYYDNDIPSGALTRINYEISSLSRLTRELDVVFYLSEVGLEALANDLMEGLRRFNAGDYEGAIKFFRKVVEGWRNLLQQQDFSIPVGEKRREALRDYVSKAYHLLSNFGEHAGTHGSYREALLSKNIAMELSRYLVSYLLEGQTHEQSQTTEAQKQAGQ